MYLSTAKCLSNKYFSATYFGSVCTGSHPLPYKNCALYGLSTDNSAPSLHSSPDYPNCLCLKECSSRRCFWPTQCGQRGVATGPNTSLRWESYWIFPRPTILLWSLEVGPVAVRDTCVVADRSGTAKARQYACRLLSMASVQLLGFADWALGTLSLVKHC